MGRFAVDTPSEPRASLWVATLLSLVYSTLTLLLRLWVKISTPGLDDAMMGLAHVFSYAEQATTIYSISTWSSLAEVTTDPGSASSFSRIFQSEGVLYVLTLAASKASVLLLLRRVFLRAELMHAPPMCAIALGIVAFWGVGSVVALTAACSPAVSGSGSTAGTCVGYTARWLAMMLTDCITEVGMVILAIFMVSRLQMRIEEKMAVAVAFSWRLGLVAFAALHYRAYARSIAGHTCTLPGPMVIICEQIGMCYSLCSATWPFSKAFVRGFDTSTLAVLTVAGSSGTQGMSSANHNSGGRSKAQSSVVGDGGHGRSTARMRPDKFRHTALVSRTGGTQNDETGSFGSQEMIIRRDDTVDVSFEAASAR